MPAPLMELIEVDPRTLLVDVNYVRAGLVKDQAFADMVASMKANGLLQPPKVYRTPDGLRVRLGERRVMASIDAGLKKIQVLFGGDESPEQDELDRLSQQWDENVHRAGLSGADEAHALQAGLDLGVKAAAIEKRLGLPKGTAAAAQAVKASAAAATAMSAQPGMNLQQLAAIAEFDGSPEAGKLLQQKAAEGDGPFRHALQQLRDQRTDQEARAAFAAELEATGVKVVAGGQPYENRIGGWTGKDREPLTPESHKDCPGSVAVVERGYGYGAGQQPYAASYYCTDPKENGHKRIRDSSGSGDPEADAQQRREVIAGNREWRSATVVRQQFLREFLARKTAPAGAARYIFDAIVRADGSLVHAMQYPAHKTGAVLVGLSDEVTLETKRREALADLMDKASDARAQVIALGMVLGSEEAAATDQTWRSPLNHGSTGRYLAALAGWGYPLSAIERAVIAGKPYKPDTEPAGA